MDKTQLQGLGNTLGLSFTDSYADKMINNGIEDKMKVSLKKSGLSQTQVDDVFSGFAKGVLKTFDKITYIMDIFDMFKTEISDDDIVKTDINSGLTTYFNIKRNGVVNGYTMAQRTIVHLSNDVYSFDPGVIALFYIDNTEGIYIVDNVYNYMKNNWNKTVEEDATQATIFSYNTKFMVTIGVNTNHSEYLEIGERSTTSTLSTLILNNIINAQKGLYQYPTYGSRVRGVSTKYSSEGQIISYSPVIGNKNNRSVMILPNSPYYHYINNPTYKFTIVSSDGTNEIKFIKDTDYDGNIDQKVPIYYNNPDEDDNWHPNEYTEVTFPDVVPPDYPPYKPPTPPDGGIVIPPEPQDTDINSTGFLCVYNPTMAQLNRFNAFLWSTDFVDIVKKMFENPMEAVVGLHFIYAKPSIDTIMHDIIVGYIDTDIPVHILNKQYTTINCGEMKIEKYYKNVLDYTATNIVLFLPFIGFRQLDISDCMDSTIKIQYTIDFLTGDCLAAISIKRNDMNSVLYQYEGNCSVQIPLTSSNYTGIISNMLNIIGSASATIASGGSLAPLAISSGINAITNSHVSIEKSGNIGGNCGAMSNKKPYIVITRKNPMVNENTETIGSPAYITDKIGSCEGWIKIEEIDLKTTAMEEERNMIIELLKSGIYV